MRGLIHIFNRYNFTITEATPLDQEVALDPELAGKVFENLLAAYNPETATTARKATGSYYTPRPIVDYMMDEALLAYLQGKLQGVAERQTGLSALQSGADNLVRGQGQIGLSGPQRSSGNLACGQGQTGLSVLPSGPDNPGRDLERRLRHLLSYTDEPHQFSSAEVEPLIAAIDNLKALDPACGSGAFPMGLLHKLVFILGKLDPRNECRKQRQIARVQEAIRTAGEIEDAVIRERTLKDLEHQITSIEDAFARNELDYGRKLYLIENCIYGVDIQPIAVQIAKMRFFISLTVDQKVDPKRLTSASARCRTSKPNSSPPTRSSASRDPRSNCSATRPLTPRKPNSGRSANATSPPAPRPPKPAAGNSTPNSAPKSANCSAPTVSPARPPRNWPTGIPTTKTRPPASLIPNGCSASGWDRHSCLSPKSNRRQECLRHPLASTS